MSLMKWMSLYNSRPNETCLVIGNGPSLRDVPTAFLRKYPSFGSNRIYLKEGFVPTYYVCVNPLVRQQYYQEIFALPCLKFLGGGPEILEPDCLNIYSVHVPLFSYAPDRWLYEGHTVTFVALQLAYFLGFTTVLLVGVDHRYKFFGKPNEETRYGGVDVNHFDPTYFSNAQWNNPDLQRSEEAYVMAKEAYEASGRKIINITQGTDLKVFEMQPIEAW